MCRSMVDIQSATVEIRRGIKKDTKKIETTGQNIMSSATQVGHKMQRFRLGSDHVEFCLKNFMVYTEQPTAC